MSVTSRGSQMRLWFGFIVMMVVVLVGGKASFSVFLLVSLALLSFCFIFLTTPIFRAVSVKAGLVYYEHKGLCC